MSTRKVLTSKNKAPNTFPEVGDGRTYTSPQVTYGTPVVVRNWLEGQHRMLNRERALIAKRVLECLGPLFIACSVPHFCFGWGVTFDPTNMGSATLFIDFQTEPDGSVMSGGSGQPGSNRDGVLEFPDISFGEHFAGQTVQTTTESMVNFDAVSGIPSSPLSIVAASDVMRSDEDFGVYTRDLTYQNVIAGIGPDGYSASFVTQSVGQGSFAILYHHDQFEVKLDVIASRSTMVANPGGARVDFYRRDGTLIHSDTSSIGNFDAQTMLWRRNGNIRDIAGVVFTNTKPAGLAFDNVFYSVPEPNSFLLLLLLVVGWAGKIRIGK